MYLIVFKRDGVERKGLVQKVDYKVVAKSATLAEAKEKRQISGDLVYTAEGVIVNNPEWLFDWEKEDPKSYAKNQMERKSFLQL